MTEATTPQPFEVAIGDTACSAPKADRVAVLSLEQGDKPVVVLDHELLQRLELTLSSLPPDISGLVIASKAPRAFVAGADLKSIMAMDDTELHRYLEYGARVFGKIASMPCWTAAAIHGACLGGGLELALHCDLLVASRPEARGDKPARPFPIGLPEAGLAICPGWGGSQMLPARIEPNEAVRQTATGKTMTSDQAETLGLFDAVAETPAALLQTTVEALCQKADSGAPRRHGGVPSRTIQSAKPDAVLAAVEQTTDLTTKAAAAVLRCVRDGLAGGFAAGLQTERDELVRLRHTDEAQSAIEAFFSRK